MTEGQKRGPASLIRTRRLASPPGSYMDHVLLTLVGSGPFTLIDAGYPESGEETLAWVEAQTGGGPDKLLLTHHHHDHAGGAEAVAGRWGVPVYAHPAEIALLAERAPSLRPLPLEEGARVEVGGVGMRVLLTPGHSPGHLALWWEEERILFGGDNVLMSTTTAVVAPLGSLRDYLATLERLRALRPRVIYPGHGPPVTDPEGRIRAILLHRRRRDEQILAALARGGGTPMRIAEGIYQGLDERQVRLGAAMVGSHLEKLLEEGKIRRRDGSYDLA